MALKRREVLRAGLLGGLAVASYGSLERAAAALTRRARGAVDAEPVLVVVVLNGGNDGLNTVIPLRQFFRYRTMRRTVAVNRGRTLPLAGLEEDFALNPGLASFQRLWAEGRLAIIPGVGPPHHAEGLFDHFASLQNLYTGTIHGSAPTAQPTGWLGRYLDTLTPASLPRGISFGHAPLMLTGLQASPLALRALDGLGIYPSDDPAARLDAYRRLQRNHPRAGVVIETNRQLREQMLTLGGDLEALGATYEESAGISYPDTDIGAALRDCAALIASRRGVRALEVTLGGFDSHVTQQIGPPALPPYHEGLCAAFGDAIAAFHADLDGHGLGATVLTLVCSEFGRRPNDNSDYGTDHGFAGPMFVIGDAVRGGVWADYPDLRDEYLVLGGNLDRTVDFRAVYATILARHFDVDPGPLLGADFEPLGFL